MDRRYTAPPIGNVVGRETLVWCDDNDKRVTFTRCGDEIYVRTEWKNVAAVLKRNAELAADFSRNQKLGEIVQVANIPEGLYYQWADEGIVDDEEYLNRRLNDAEFAKLRTNNLVL
ncbi:hypothetical protein [Agrobacterium tumefaciens]|uniref:hypothetical protein n=1 Tax=Agrobacterium tumefaciens TaxID=358 RepID=UPI001111D91D